MPAEIPSITRDQAVNLAAVLHDMRPRWSTEAIVTLIHKNLGTIPDYPSLVLAAVTVALDETKQTPAIIFLPGKHWDSVATKLGPWDKAFHRMPPCQDHPEEEAHNCRCCHADVKTGIRPPSHIGKHHEPQETTP